MPSFPRIPSPKYPTDIITDIEDWNPATLDAPDTIPDKVDWVFKQAAVGAARKIVAIANGDHVNDDPRMLKLEMHACEYVISQVISPGGTSKEKPWQTWLQDMVKGESGPKEPSKSDL